MPLSLLPTIVADSVTDLTPDLLHKHGIKLLMLDFDNTIVPYTCDEPTDKMVRWLSRIRRSGIKICVVSNSRRYRVRIVCSKYGIPCITQSKKPFSRGIKQCMAYFKLKPEECALAGDQIYTDVLGANCAGVKSILVNAIHNHNTMLKVRGVLEMPFRAVSKGRRIKK